MNSIKQTVCQRTRGAALIVSLIFVLVFSGLAVSIASLSATNVQIAENQRKANCARACAESGLEVVRFWLSRVVMPSNTPITDYFNTIIKKL